VTAVRRLIAALAAVSVAAALVLLASRSPAERDAAWNVIVVVTDDQTADSIPHDPPVMPYLQASAADPAEHWVAFGNAFVTTPLCCPSRATLLTGRYAHRHGVLTNDDGSRLDEASTVAAWLDGAGYHTGLVGKYLNGYPFGRTPFVPLGWDRWWARAQGPASSLYYDYTLIGRGVATGYGSGELDYATDVLAAKAVDFVSDAPTDRPFFLWFAPTAPHPPWVSAPRHEGDLAGLTVVPGPGVGEADVSDKPSWVRALPPLDSTALAGLALERRQSYEALLAVDDAVRAIVTALRDRGDLDRTVIVFVSDNGYAFGEHRWTAKRCPYDECIRVPLLVRYPPTTGRTDASPVSTVDLAPTIAELAGVGPTGPVDGSSLLPRLDGGSGGATEMVFSEWIGDEDVPQWWEVRTEAFAYIELGTGERELYDLRSDPFELENAVLDPANSAVLAELSAALERFRGS
jgi:arylsulfatase A-like enzyme